MINISDFKNPQIKVTYEDLAENITKEKLNSIKEYFYKKYNALSVDVVPKPIRSKIINFDNEDVDIETSIFDFQYQKKLIKKYIDDNKIQVDWEKLNILDDKVNEELTIKKDTIFKSKLWRVKKIEFSNFLSYGEDNVLDFNELIGLTIVLGKPQNYSGKTTLTIDLLLFLFFNETSKNKKMEEIFNLFTNKDEVKIKGYIEIDNEIYVIERILTRKRTKKEEYKYENKLNFFKENVDGSIENLNEEERKSTEKFIKESIGSKEDFFLTIVTDGDNLNDIITTKPTERGNIFSRFVGIEILSDKESIAKEILNEYSKNLKSNIFNIEELKNDITKLIDDNKNINENIKNDELNLKNIDNKIIYLNNEKKGILSKKINIDNEIEYLDVEKTKGDISKLNLDIQNKTDQIEIWDKEIIGLKSDFNVDLYNEMINKEKELYKTKTKYEAAIESISVDINNGNKAIEEKQILNNDLDKYLKIIKDKEDEKLKINYNYDNEKHEQTLKDEKTLIIEISNITSKIEISNENLKQIQEGTICPTCKRPLEDVDHTDEINLLENEIKDLNEKLRLLQDKKEGIDEILNSIKKELDKKDIHDKIEKEINKIENDINILKSNINIYDEQINKKDIAEKRIFKGKEELSKVQTEWDGINNNIKLQEIEKENLRKKESIELNKTRFELEIQQIQININKNRELLKKYNDNIEYINGNKKLDENLMSIEFELSTKNTERDTFKEKIITYKNTIQNNNKDIQDKEKIITIINQENENIKIYKVYIEIFSKKGIRTMILSSVLPYFNIECNRLLYDVVPFEIKTIMNNKNELEFMMYYPDEDIQKPLYSGSGFEKTVGSLALRTVLNTISNLSKTNFIVFDEVMGKVGEENYDKIENLFFKIKEKFEHVLFITHNPSIKDWGDSYINVVKENNITKIL